MNNKLYAPVLIPTLNRYEHFKQCLESLEKCTDADNTDVYVALDFPPSDGYRKGWERIDSYLIGKEKLHGFNHLIVIRREYNCGIGGPKSNIGLLLNQVIEKYDRYILSEDDNIFSKNFLVFMNQSLALSENNDSIIAVCGYSYPFDYKFSGNNFYFSNSDFCAWGTGYLVSRRKGMINDFHNGFFARTFSFKNYFKIRKKSWYLLDHYMNCVFHEWAKDYSYRKTDVVLCVYMIIKDYNMLKPAFSKVKNIGWDDLGQSFKKRGIPPKLIGVAERHRSQIIDDSIDFELSGDPYSNYEYNNQVTLSSGEWPMSYFEYVWGLFRRPLHGFWKLIKSFLRK